MSIPVDLEELRDEVARRRHAPYLLTVADDARPHAAAVAADWDGDALRCEVGRRTGANASARPLVSLLWPPDEPGGYSLIVDGDARVDDDALHVRPTRAVLHRPAPSPASAGDTRAQAGDGSCASDCREILPR